jgi:ELWxxDGT repeat protein
LLGSSVIFAATDPANGQEVWISDGTAAGTSIVRDIRPGSAGSSPAGFAVVGNRVYFSANDGTNGSEPWFTDGTTGGTQMLRDIRTGGLASSSPSSFTAFGANVLFVADDGTNGFELWFSDGTTGGTILLKDIYPGTTPSSISSITVSGGLAFFRATSPSEGSELWRTNGTPAGTVLVADIFSGGSSSDPSLFFPYNNGILFSATDGSSGRELWFSDGTTGGTLQVADTNAGAASGQPAWLAEIGGQVLFFSTSASEGRELWKTNGAVGGTQLVKDIYPGRYDSLYTSGEMRVVGGYAYFFALDKTESLALWRSDGTATGTTMAAAGVDGAAPVGTGFTIPFGTQLLVIMGTPEYGQELWLLAPGSTNVPPTVSLSATTWTYTENNPATLVDPGATVTDPDSADFDGGVLTVAYLSGQNSANRLRVRNIGTGAGQIGISGNNVSFGGVMIGTVSGGTGTSNLQLTFNASSSPAAAQAALRAIEFEIQSDDPGAASRVLSITLSDGDGGTSTAVQLTIAVVPVNDPTTMIVPTTPTSGFTGPAGGPFTFTLGSASASVTTAHLQLVDPDNLMSITSVTVSTPAPGSLSGPPLQSGLTSGAILSWTGLAANTLPGSYTWTVDVSDGQGNTFTFLATIVVPNDVPTFQYGSAVSAGTGTVAQPYRASAVVGAQPTLHIATVLDTCQVQTLQMTGVTPDAGNPSNVFNFSMTAGPFPRTLNALTMSVLAASDAGAHRFAVDVTDGLATVTLHVRIDVASSGNQPPVVVPAAGSQFAGTAAAGFLLQVDAGSTVTGIGTLEVSDPEGDTITILSVTIAPYAPNTVLGPTAPGPGLSGFVISFNGQMNVAETPGDYVWTITLRDAANNTVVLTATIRLRDAVPTHQIGPEALSGDGSPGTPYETSVVVGWSSPLQMFEIMDPNTSQTHSIVSVVPGAGNPTGGAGFAWSIPTPFSYVVADPPLPLNALDVGVHDFAVTISDGTNNVTVHVRITVTNPGGGGGGGGDDGGGCAVAPQAGLSVLACGLMLLVLVRRRRLCGQ